MPSDEVKDLVGYERKLRGMTYAALMLEARRVGLPTMTPSEVAAIGKQAFVKQILDAQGLDDTRLAEPLDETCVIITVPDTVIPDTDFTHPTQVLVRLPGHLDPTTIQVDFRQGRGGVWTPSDFFENSKEVRHQ